MCILSLIDIPGYDIGFKQGVKSYEYDAYKVYLSPDMAWNDLTSEFVSRVFDSTNIKFRINETIKEDIARTWSKAISEMHNGKLIGNVAVDIFNRLAKSDHPEKLRLFPNKDLQINVAEQQHCMLTASLRDLTGKQTTHKAIQLYGVWSAAKQMFIPEFDVKRQKEILDHFSKAMVDTVDAGTKYAFDPNSRVKDIGVVRVANDGTVMLAKAISSTICSSEATSTNKVVFKNNITSFEGYLFLPELIMTSKRVKTGGQLYILSAKGLYTHQYHGGTDLYDLSSVKLDKGKWKQTYEKAGHGTISCDFSVLKKYLQGDIKNALWDSLIQVHHKEKDYVVVGSRYSLDHHYMNMMLILDLSDAKNPLMGVIHTNDNTFNTIQHVFWLKDPEIWKNSDNLQVIKQYMVMSQILGNK